MKDITVKLKINNFGPIQNLQVELKPMTVIIGRNNIGKSFFTQLVYSIIDTSERFTERMGLFYRYFEFEFFGVRSSVERLRKLSKQIKFEKPDEKALFNLAFNEVLSQHCDLMQTIFRLSLERSFGVKIDKLVNVRSRKSRIEWDYSANVSVTIEITRQGKMTLVMKPNQEVIVESEEKTRSLIQKTKKARTRTFDFLSQVFFEIARTLFRPAGRQELYLRRPRNAFYIPAGRAGLVESYDTVVSALISLSPIAPVKGLSMPPLPGMAAQFYDVLLRLKGHKGPFNVVLSNSFRKLFGGDIVLKRVEQKGKSRLFYVFESDGTYHSIEIIHAASMIKELAPIYLIIRELIQTADFLLIEEPESHLHPGAQLDLVNMIAILVNKGVNICITTHSDIFLRRIAHLIGEHQRKKSELFLDPGKVAIYWLREERIGSKSKELKVPKKGTLDSIPTFDQVIEDLYEEELELQRKP